MSTDATWLLDIGNTRGKWLRVDSSTTARAGYFELGDLPEGLHDSPSVQVLIASVASPERDSSLQQALQRCGHRVWFARAKREVPGLVNSYSEPARMGVDRWLAMLAASRRGDGRFCVVDAGSALTIDFVDAQGRHEGGYILPGRQLMEQALLGRTDRVRYEETAGPSLQPGRSTAEAVKHGLTLAQVGAVRAALAETASDAAALFLCGGDADALEKLLERPCQRVDKLVFEGLWIQAVLESVLEGLQEVPVAIRS